jgi:hypothetical protein
MSFCQLTPAGRAGGALLPDHLTSTPSGRLSDLPPPQPLHQCGETHPAGIGNPPTLPPRAVHHSSQSSRRPTPAPSRPAARMLRKAWRRNRRREVGERVGANATGSTAGKARRLIKGKGKPQSACPSLRHVAPHRRRQHRTTAAAEASEHSLTCTALQLPREDQTRELPGWSGGRRRQRRSSAPARLAGKAGPWPWGVAALVPDQRLPPGRGLEMDGHRACPDGWHPYQPVRRCAPGGKPG